MITEPSEKDEIYLNNVAKIGNSPENIHLIENVLSEEEHKTILDFVNSTDAWTYQPWDAFDIPHKEIPREIIYMLHKVFTLAQEKCTSVYGVDINPANKNILNLLKFPRGMLLKPHIDTLSDEGNHIAAVYYINDSYLGGEICFPEFNINIKPNPNSLIIFPGNESYLHEVRKVYKGDRYSSSMWFQFTGSTFNQKKEWYG